MKVIGHRGASGLAPENTFAGFDLALEIGVDGIETLERYGAQALFDLEIKQIGIENEVLDTVEHLNLLNRVVFTSRDFPTICNIKKKNPRAQVGYLTADFAEETLE